MTCEIETAPLNLVKIYKKFSCAIKTNFMELSPS
jgi:hypothetical protein